MGGERGLLGQAKAIHEATQESAQSLKESTQQIGRLQSRLERAVQEAEGIRELKYELEDMIEKARRPAWVTSVQLAAMLSVHEGTIRRWYRQGRIRGHQIERNGYIRFDLDEVREDIRGFIDQVVEASR